MKNAEQFEKVMRTAKGGSAISFSCKTVIKIVI
jgi:hypothetical protein